MEISTFGKVISYNNGMSFPRKRESSIVIKSQNKKNNLTFKF